MAASAAQRASCSDAFAAFSQSIESIKNRVLPETALPPPATRSWCAGHRDSPATLAFVPHARFVRKLFALWEFLPQVPVPVPSIFIATKNTK